MQIPQDVLEVATLESATEFQKFWYIKLRYLSSTILFVAILSLINSFKVFREVYLLTGDYPYDSLYMLQHFMNNTFRSLDYQKLSAAAIIMCLVMCVVIGILVLCRRSLRKGCGRIMKRKKVKLTIKKILLTCVAVIFAVSFLLPTILTIANSFMSSAEINTNYGVIFNQYKETSYGERNTDYVAEKVNLKFIPDMVELSQYTTVLLKSPEYLLKFWNSVILVVPIVVFQIFIALGAAYSFMRFRGRIREIIFFVYVALMLMPYQVTLVPNYLVADWLKILDTRASIILPGIFAPFSVYLLNQVLQPNPEFVDRGGKIRWSK